MAKIEISTVKREANVECIFLNASIISRVIRAKNVLEGAIQGLRFSCDGKLSSEEICEVEDHVLGFINEIVDAMLDEEK